jgi:hypothetical protein
MKWRIYFPLLLIFSASLILSCSKSITEPGPQESILGIELEGNTDVFNFLGGYSDVRIILNLAPDKGLDGFNLLIAYNDLALTFIQADLAEETACWEYFNYELVSFDECGEDCPAGLVRLTGLRDVNYGPYHPENCEGANGFFDGPDVVLANIKFLVTEDPHYDCQVIPVYFYWLDCEDNTITCGGDETIYISNHVFDLNWQTSESEYVEMFPPDGQIDSNDFIYGASDNCEIIVKDGNRSSNRVIDFYNGIVDIACIGPEHFPGDVNVNNLSNEIADFLLFAEYFIYGDSAFTINLEYQIAETNVNGDTACATLEDFIYMLRIMTGDALPYSQIQHYNDTATVRLHDNTLTVESDTAIGAIWLILNDTTALTLLADYMDILHDDVDSKTKILIYNLGTASIPSGVNDLLHLDYIAEIIHFEAVDYYGNRLVSIIENP